MSGAVRRTPIVAQGGRRRCVLAFSSAEETLPVAGVAASAPFEVMQGGDRGYTATPAPAPAHGLQMVVLCPRRDPETAEVVLAMEPIAAALDLRRNNAEVRFCEPLPAADRRQRYANWGDGDSDDGGGGARSPDRDDGPGLDGGKRSRDGDGGVGPRPVIRPFEGPLLIGTDPAPAATPPPPPPPEAPAAPAVAPPALGQAAEPPDPANPAVPVPRPGPEYVPFSAPVPVPGPGPGPSPVPVPAAAAPVAAPPDLGAAVRATVRCRAGQEAPLTAVLADALQRTADFPRYRAAERAVGKAWFRVCRGAVLALLADSGCCFPSGNTVAFPAAAPP